MPALLDDAAAAPAPLVDSAAAAGEPGAIGDANAFDGAMLELMGHDVDDNEALLPDAFGWDSAELHRRELAMGNKAMADDGFRDRFAKVRTCLA